MWLFCSLISLCESGDEIVMDGQRFSTCPRVSSYFDLPDPTYRALIRALTHTAARKSKWTLWNFMVSALICSDLHILFLTTVYLYNGYRYNRVPVNVKYFNYHLLSRCHGHLCFSYTWNTAPFMILYRKFGCSCPLASTHSWLTAHTNQIGGGIMLLSASHDLRDTTLSVFDKSWKTPGNVFCCFETMAFSNLGMLWNQKLDRVHCGIILDILKIHLRLSLRLDI